MKFGDIITNPETIIPEKEQKLVETDDIIAIMSEEMKSKLEVLAGVNENDYTYTERGIKFNFKNSLRANVCQIIEYHDKIIVELRRQSDNILEGTYNKLVSEKIIDKSELMEHFENETGVYLSYI